MSFHKEEPQPNRKYLCELRNCLTGEITMVTLRYVIEDDCSWRTIDDNSELNFDWDVINYKETE